ncbi:hypothetical protein, partial [Mycoplasma phocoeninasale]|uniref:hypothetical protein n=1 Tax=Mycoplasma phocoeninasale TaxID=2726117 RepID=UPI00196747F5
SNTSELSFEISAKQNLNTIIKINETLKVEELTISEVQKLIKAKYPQIDIEQLEFTIADQQNGHILVKAKNDSKDYIGEVNFNVTAKIDLTKEIKVDGLGKVNAVTEDEIKRIVNEANADKSIKWEQLKITINGNNITIKAVDDSADYSNTTHLSFNVTAKIDLTKEIKVAGLDKVNAITEEEIKRIVNAANADKSIKWEQLKITINGNNITIKAVDDSADYSNISELSFEISAKQNLNTIIKNTEALKVEELTISEVQKLIKMKYPQIDIEQLEFTISDQQNGRISIKAKNDSKDYVGEISFNVATKIDLTKEIKVAGLDKVNAITEEEIKRVVNAANAGKSIKWEQLKITINGNKITIKAVDDSADYSNTSELSFEISAKQNLSKIIEINNWGKVNKVDDIIRLINNKYPQVDTNQLEFTILDTENNSFLIRAKVDSKDYIGEIKITTSNKPDIITLIKDKKIKFELGEIEEKNINEKYFAEIIKKIFKDANVDNLNFKIRIDKENKKIIVDFSSDDNYSGELTFRYKLLDANKQRIRRNIITITLSILLGALIVTIPILIIILLNRKSRSKKLNNNGEKNNKKN